jgi:FAD synthase
MYGEPASVQFLAFLRSERRFAGLDELKDQLVLDIEHARTAVLARRGRL